MKVEITILDSGFIAELKKDGETLKSGAASSWHSLSPLLKEMLALKGSYSREYKKDKTREFRAQKTKL